MCPCDGVERTLLAALDGLCLGILLQRRAQVSSAHVSIAQVADPSLSPVLCYSHGMAIMEKLFEVVCVSFSLRTTLPARSPQKSTRAPRLACRMNFLLLHDDFPFWIDYFYLRAREAADFRIRRSQISSCNNEKNHPHCKTFTIPAACCTFDKPTFLMSLLQEGGSGDTINLSFRSLSNIPDDVWQAFQLKKLVLAGMLFSFFFIFDCIAILSVWMYTM
jgi:hypothetical protein